MKKVLEFYKYIYSAMGPKSLILLAIMLGAYYISGRSYYYSGDAIGLYITSLLTIIYHVAFFFDRRKKEKMKKK